MSITDEERIAIVNYRIEKSYNTYNEALQTCSLSMFSLAANRLYYAVYHAAGALLIANGIAAHSHSGLMTMVHLHFIKSGILSRDDGLLLRRLFSLRQRSDYDDFIEIEENELTPFIPSVKAFIDKIAHLVDYNSSN